MYVLLQWYNIFGKICNIPGIYLGTYHQMESYAGNRRLIRAEMEGCQVRDWIVGERDMPFSRILYMVIMCEWRLV